MLYILHPISANMIRIRACQVLSLSYEDERMRVQVMKRRREVMRPLMMRFVDPWWIFEANLVGFERCRVFGFWSYTCEAEVQQASRFNSSSRVWFLRIPPPLIRPRMRTYHCIAWWQTAGSWFVPISNHKSDTSYKMRRIITSPNPIFRTLYRASKHNAKKHQIIQAHYIQYPVNHFNTFPSQFHFQIPLIINRYYFL